MGHWGILEDTHLETVPGTALLDDIKKASEFSGDTDHLKKDGRTILVPQPSDDPRDPLNWPMWKKEMCFLTLSFMAGLVGAIGPLVSSGYVDIAADIGASVNSVAASNGYLLIGLGVAMFFQSALAVKYGRRPAFLLGGIVLFVCCIWSGVSKGQTSFTLSRVFQGAGMAPYEALVTATIGDLYFVHQRGLRITVWGFALIAGISVAPLVNGYVIDGSLGWKWCFWLITIFFGIGTVLVFFFVPETIYHRAAVYNTDSGASAREANQVEAAVDHLGHKGPLGDEEKIGYGHQAQDEHVLADAHITQNFLPPKTFVQELAPWSGYVNPTSIITIFIRPFPLALSPVVFCGFFIYGLTTAWIVVLSVSSSIIFGSPPLNFDARSTGLMSVGPFIASICGALIVGPLIDYMTKWFARHNKGVYEPEARLLLLIPMLLFMLAGFLGWRGMLTSNVTGWIGPEVMYSLIYFGNGLGSTAIVAYVIDVHRQHASEAFAVINFSKNMLIYGFTQFVVNWIVADGLPKIFGTLAGLNTLCILFGVPLWIFGKRFRSFIHRHPTLYSNSNFI